MMLVYIPLVILYGWVCVQGWIDMVMLTIHDEPNQKIYPCSSAAISMREVAV